MEISNLGEAIWKNHYQIVVSRSDDKGAERPIFFGSGFILVYKSHHWLITADHLIHPDKHGMDKPIEEGVDNEYNYFLVNNENVKNELKTAFTSLYGFYFFDKFVDLTEVFNEKELKELNVKPADFFERVDVAFSDITFCNFKWLTHDLRDCDGNLIVPAGQQKLMILEESIAEPNEDYLYYDFGVVQNDIKGGIRFERVNALHSELRYAGKEDELFLFKTLKAGNLNEWEALSGSAMFDEKGKVVGMTIRYDEENGIVRVLPMKIILRLIDYSLKYESDKVKMNIDIIQQLRSLELSTYPQKEVAALVNQFSPKIINVTIEGPLFIERIRKGGSFTKRSEVTYKEGHVHDKYNRATIPGQTIFYGVICHESEPKQNRRYIELSEISDLLHSGQAAEGCEIYTLSKWVLKRPIKVGVIVNDTIFEGLDNQLLRDAKEVYKQHCTFIDAPLGLTEYSNFVTEEFSKPVNDDFEYMISANIAERMMNATNLDGIMYPSVRTGGYGGMNVALKRQAVDDALYLEKVVQMEYVQANGEGISRILKHAKPIITDEGGMTEWTW